MMFLVFVSLSMRRPDCCAIAFHWLSPSWLKLMKVTGPFDGPKGMTVYVCLMALGPWEANFN